jgi:signal transduction histidine kinase
MKVGTRPPMFVVAAALLGLIALLATLQYRWLGQVSAAERERMKTNLAARASGFAQDFDREITRAYFSFQLDPLQEGGVNLAAHLSERHDHWKATSRYPRLVKDVYVASRAGEQDATLQRFNPSTRFVEPSEWPAELAPIRAALEPAPPITPKATTIFVRTMPATVWDAIPALVVPAPMVLFGSTRVPTGPEGAAPVRLPPMSFVVLTLDREYVANEMLPAIARQHFRGAGEDIDYEMAVVSTGTKATVYSTRSGFAPDPAATSDASADLFQLRLQEFGAIASEVRRFTSFISTRVDHPQKGTPIEGRIAIREAAPVSIVLQHGGMADKRAIETSLATARTSASSPHWRLVVKHPSGSLETAVAQVRRRNLLVSSGILAILGASVGFLLVTTRRAQDLARQQMEFVAAVSHELRTPLAVIRSAADNLAEGVVNEDPQVRKYGDLVRGEGRRLSDMVEQILELAGIHSGQRGFALAPVPIVPLLRDVIRASGTLIEQAGLNVEYEAPDTLPAVLGDEQALRRVFQNLVGNAIKYGASGGWIGLSARVNGRELVVTVADRGIGIEPSEQAKIFEPFYRAPQAIAAQIQGAGLGLSLVQRIVEAHGGRITLRSSPGAGSEFTVHLPAASEEAAERASHVPDPAGTSA